MKLDFAKTAKRNMAASFANSAVRLLFPFLNRTVFLWLLGPEYLGLNGLFTSVLGVLMLAELGFGTAVVCSMYKPVADDDKPLIRAYLLFYRTVYRRVGAAIFTIGLCLMPFIGSLVKGNVPSDVNLHILYFVHLTNTSLSYFLFAYRGSVLGAYGRKDVLVNISSFVSVAQYVTVFLTLLLTRNYYCYVAATVLFTVVQNVLIVKSSRRLFPEIEPDGELDEARRKAVMSDVKSIFMHKVGGVISYSVDNIVISAFLGLVAVASYGNYYYVLTSVGTIVAAVYTSLLGGFGNKIHTESKEDNFRLFMRSAKLVLAIIVWCAAMMSALYQPFMHIWTGGNESLMRHALTPILMVAYFYVRESRQVLLTFKSAASLWREDRLKPVVAGAANLAINIALVILLPEEYKLDGVIFSTIATFALIQMPWETHILFSRFFSRSQGRAYWAANLRFLVLAAAVSPAAWFLASLVGMDGIPGIFVKACVAFAVATPACLLAAPELLSIAAGVVRRKK